MNVKIFTDLIEERAEAQVYEMANLPAFKDAKIRIMPDVHAGMGCVIGFTADLGDKVIPNIVGVDIGCLDKDTEVLTPNGWVYISNYKNQDILQFDKDTEKTKFIKPLAYIVEDCDEFYWFKNSKGLDQMVSSEHSMLVYKGYKSRGYSKVIMQPEDLMNQKRVGGYYSFLAAFKHEGDGLDMTDNQIRLDMMIADDARIRKSHIEGINDVHLHFSKPRKIERAIELLTNEGIDFTKNISEVDETTNIYFKISNTYNKNLVKYYKANFNQLKVLSEESLLWDGHKGYRSYYSNTNKDNVDVIQFAFSSTGIRTGIHETKTVNDDWKLSYQATPTKNPYVGYSCDVELVDSIDGKKYCFITDTGFFVARRNGKIFITGNCGMRTIKLGQIDIDLQKLDLKIRTLIPSGFNTHDRQREFPLENLRCFKELKNPARIRKSIGTLGGGNHFIEVDVDEISNKYLIIHTGSRNLGHQVADLYQKKAIEYKIGRASCRERV